MTDPTAGLGGPTDKPRSLAGDAWRDLRRNPIFLVSCGFLLVVLSMAVAPGLWTDIDVSETCQLKYARQSPSPGHPFGFDAQGCDLYSYVVHGARPSIMVGLIVTVLSALIAIVVGSLAGFYGGWLDALLQRVTDVFFGMPFVLAALLVLTRLDRHDVLSVSLVFVVFAGWPTMSRVMRGNVLGLKNADYVQAARALGASNLRLMLRHILPNAIMPLLVLSTLMVGSVIGAEAALTFLGVGLQYPTVSWGIALNKAQQYFLEAPHLLVFPSLFLVVTVLSFILIGDAVRDAFDPKLR